MRHLKKSHKKAPLNPKPSFVASPSQRAVEPSHPNPMTRHRSAIGSMSPKMEIRSKRLHMHPASFELEAKHTKKKLKVDPSMVSLVPIIASPVAGLPTPTPSAPAPKDKRKASTNPQVRGSPRFPTGEKLLAGSVRAAHALESHQHLPKQKLQKQYPSEGGSGSLFFGIEEYSQEFLFLDIESEELGGDFGGDVSDSYEDLLEEEEPLTMIASPEVIETRESAAELASLESKIPLFLFLLPFPFICSLIWPYDVEILFATLSPLSPLSQVAEVPKLPLARPVSIK